MSRLKRVRLGRRDEPAVPLEDLLQSVRRHVLPKCSRRLVVTNVHHRWGRRRLLDVCSWCVLKSHPGGRAARRGASKAEWLELSGVRSGEASRYTRSMASARRGPPTEAENCLRKRGPAEECADVSGNSAALAGTESVVAPRGQVPRIARSTLRRPSNSSRCPLTPRAARRRTSEQPTPVPLDVDRLVSASSLVRRPSQPAQRQQPAMSRELFENNLFSPSPHATTPPNCRDLAEEWSAQPILSCEGGHSPLKAPRTR